MSSLHQKSPYGTAPFIGGPIGVGGQTPVSLEIIAVEEADCDLGVADVERQEHGRSYR